MHNKIVLVHRLLFITFLIGYISIFGMERLLIEKIYIPRQIFLVLATEYNKNNSFLALPNELMVSIISHKKQSLENIIKTALSLRSTCKYLNTSLLVKEIGQACIYYDKAEKNKVMEKLLRSMNDLSYWNKRQAAFLLTYAGADSNAYKDDTLLLRAVQRKDEDMINALFENKANPNEKLLKRYPAFFHIRDVVIAKIFIAQGVDVHAKGWNIPNILWYLIENNPLFEVIELYLNQKVDPKKIGREGHTIFHHLAYYTRRQKSSKECIKITKLLFNAAPKLLNIKNEYGRTALDQARESLKSYRWWDRKKKILEALISFFEKCNAAQQQV